MLPKNAVVKVRKAIGMGYDGLCTITEQQKYTRPNKSTGFREVAVIENQPCRLSFTTAPSTNSNGAVSGTAQTVKLFLAPELDVKEGSKITVTQNGVTTDYRRSGTPAVYPTHQEIILELFKGWA